ncbi:unnamed protein product [Meganyctiphanes norvegica]|uniref:Cationic amino acid transporter C-terminal domain-containing protein n=1 Tax=Meganyctiphanes norvegica TaxID=48144 RepID=A0AAV2RDY2_MEGNR
MASSHEIMTLGKWRRLWHRMSRTKQISSDVMETPLNRCLSTMDITLLGIGNMIGAGIYVLTGTVAKNAAGPAIILSFLLAGFVSLLAALCYAEFGARIPKAGSAYVYTYVTIGEFLAFVIGWNIVLEHMIGAASVARAWSGYCDSLFEGAVSRNMIKLLGHMPAGQLADYPDFLAFTVILVYCGILSLGVKGSTLLNSIFTIINLCILFFVIAVGYYFADLLNWESVESGGNAPGGFCPYGFSGIITGAATCFYAFVGFDSIATAGEEARSPARSLPIATIISMAVVTAVYVLVSSSLTLMVPYNTLNPAAAMPDAFSANGAWWAKYVVSIGALCGLTTSLMGSLFTLPRCVYAMAADGLLFSWLAKVNDKSQVPVINLAFCGLLSALLALLFDIEKLVEFMSIGTLMAYTIVSASVIILRYQPASRCNIKSDTNTHASQTSTTFALKNDKGTVNGDGGELRSCFSWMALIFGKREPGQLVTMAVFIFIVVSASMCALLQWGSRFMQPSPSWWVICILINFIGIIQACVLIIVGHRQNQIVLTFRVPLVPLVPLISIFFNVALMVHLNPMTWIRFLVWMTIGLIIYFAYGQNHVTAEEPAISFSTLLTEPTPAKRTMFGSIKSSFLKEDKQPIIDLEGGGPN